MSFRNAGARAALREHNRYIQCTEISRIKKTCISGWIFILPVFSFLWSETTESAQNSDCNCFFPHHAFVFVVLSIRPWACSLAIWQPLTTPARGQNAVQLPTWSFLHCVYFYHCIIFFLPLFTLPELAQALYWDVLWHFDSQLSLLCPFLFWFVLLLVLGGLLFFVSFRPSLLEWLWQLMPGTCHQWRV